MKLPKILFFPIAILAGSLTAPAEVIYSDFQDIGIATNFTGVYLNVLTGATSYSDDPQLAGWHINPFFGGVGVANSAAFQPLRETASGLGRLSNIGAGDSIGSGSTNYATGSGGSQDHLGNTFTAGQEGYIGFGVDNNASINYGWMRVIFDGSGGAYVKDWAYDTSGGAINAARITQSVPSGGTQQYTLSPGAGESFVLGSAMNDSGGNTNSVVMNGQGTVSLSAVNTHTGTTTINSGTLNVVGNGALNNSNINLDGGSLFYNSSTAYSATLTFTQGTFGGTNLNGALSGLTIAANQVLSPGDGIGSASTVDQTWGSGGTYRLEMNDAAGVAGGSIGWDLVQGSGLLTVGADLSSQFTIAITSHGVDVDNFDLLSNYSWLIADFGSTVDGYSEDAFLVDVSGLSNAFNGSFGVARGDAVTGGDGSQIYLTYTAIPEPGAALLGSLGVLLLLRRRR